MANELYRKLVDMYAAGELPEDLESEMEQAAFADKDLAHDMMTLRTTAQALKAAPQPEFTEESYHRILMKLYTSGVEVKTKSPAPLHLQYNLPMAG
ncbi:MAG TPA: hypothetical protein PLX06_08835 [Fimbriimonadaceae bacterium]|nr:hypothetical protein [Fimbriimonadaceae bacterium]